MRFQPKAVLFIAGIVACFQAGCSRLDSSTTPLEQILTNFKEGKQDDSVQKFIDSVQRSSMLRAGRPRAVSGYGIHHCGPSLPA